MSYFIEKYKSSFTGNTLYSKRPMHISKLDKQLHLTALTRYLKTLDVIQFPWYKEKNGIYFYPGLRKLQPVPFKYQVPPLYFLTGQKAPKSPVRYEIVKKTIDPVHEKVEGLLF